MRRRVLRLLVPLSLLVAAVLAVPSLGHVRHQLVAIDPWWVAAAVGLEVASCVSFVVVFRAFFHRVPASLSRRIAWVEMGSGALLPGGGVTSYVLGGLLLSEAGMKRRDIVVRSGGVFWLTSAVNAAALALGAVLLEAGAGHGPRDVLEGGLAGALVLYGAPPATTAAAVLVYHAIAFWIPSLGGLGAYAALLARSRSNRSDHASVTSPPPASARRPRHRLGCPGRPSDALRPAAQRQS